MRKNLRKGMAVLLAAAMVFSTPVAVSKTEVKAAETPAVVTGSSTTEDVVDVENWWTAWSNYYQVEGNFDAEFTVKNEAKKSVYEMANFHTPSFVFTTDADRGEEAYREYLLLRSDDFWWGWGNNADNSNAKDTPGDAGTKDDIVKSVQSTTDWTDWTAWKTAVKDGTVKVSIKRAGDNFTFKEEVIPKGQTEARYHYTVTFTAQAAQKMRIVMTTEQNKATITSYTYTPAPGIIGGLLGDDIRAELSEDGKKVNLAYSTKQEIPEGGIDIQVNGTHVASGPALTVTGAVTGAAAYVYNLKDGDSELRFDVIAPEQTIGGEKYLAQTKTVTIKVAKSGDKYVYDADLFEAFKAEEGSEGLNITWKALNGVAVKAVVSGGGKTITLTAPRTVKFSELTAGTKYTVTLTATKAGYADKSATESYTYSSKFEEYTVGTTDKKTAFWKVFSKPYQINDKKTRVVELEVHGGTALYHNFVLAFANQEDFNEATRGTAYTEYAAVRTDRWGWAGSNNNKSLSGKDIQYVAHSLVSGGKTMKMGDTGFDEAFIAIMESAKATVEISRDGKMLEIRMNIASTKNAKNVITSTTRLELGTADGKDKGTGKVYMRMTPDNSYFIVKNVTEKDSTTSITPPADNGGGDGGTGGTAKVSKVTLKVPNKYVKKGTIYMKKGDKVTVKASVSGSGSPSKKVTWKSSKTKVAAVKSGKITAKKAGTAKITATSSADKTKKATLTVKVSKKKTANKKLKISPTKKILKKGKSLTIKIKKITAKTTEKVTYKSSKKSVATVDAYGKVKAKKKGKATITVKCGKKKAKLALTVKK